MVNDSHGPGRAGRIPNDAEYELKINPDAHLLMVGTRVKPNFVSRHAVEGHPEGVILGIANGIARVRWDAWREKSYPVHHLIKV